MRQHGLFIVVVLALAGGSTDGRYLLRFTDGSIRVLGTFEVWGYHIPSWSVLPDEQWAFETYWQPKAVHGINSVGFTLHDPARGSTFFHPDGEPADKATVEKFTKLAGIVRYHLIATVVSPFSADRRAWLASPDAYRRAVQAAANAVPQRHSVIFVIGDPFTPEPWPAEAPLALNEPSVFLELAGLIKQIHPDILLAVPAASLAAADEKHWLYVSYSIEALAEQMRASSNPGLARSDIRDVLVISRERFLTDSAEHTADRKTMDDFLKRVEQTRLAVRLPELSSDPAREPVRLSPEEEQEGWEPLFDGRTLNGWTTLLPDAGGWVARDGVLHCTGQSGPWLRTREVFNDFLLRIEFKIEPDGNSGVFLRAPLDGRASRIGMEMQIYGPEPAPPDSRNSTGAIYSVLAPFEKTAKPPGQWNRAEIACRGSRITISINGRLAQDLDMDDVPELKNRLRRGVIGLQDHGDKVWFRNIRVKRLNPGDHQP